MKPSWIISDNVISCLGNTSSENYERLKKGDSGIKEMAAYNTLAGFIEYNEVPGYINDQDNWSQYSRFEKLAILSIKSALKNVSVKAELQQVILIISTTKGNIDLLDQKDYKREKLLLSYSASKIATYFDNPNKPIVISNACVSGVMALLVANRMLHNGKYKHAIVVGVDLLSSFVLTGFRSLNAMSTIACKPFDKDRSGISLGEGAATLILSSVLPQDSNGPAIKILGGGLSNDANHISGPSKTGEELALAIKNALDEANLSATDIDFVSAHGTATLYNDEMEAKAFHLTGLQQTPLNSLKGSFGHTLGAAGVIESAMTIHGLKNNAVWPTVGFEHLGVSRTVNVSSSCREGDYSTALKTASGFGGCNAAIIFQKLN